MAPGTATVETQDAVEQIVGVLQERHERLAEAMVVAIKAEIPAYARASGEVVEDVRAHCDTHAGLILEVARADREPRREELAFAREAAARRVRQGVPLDALLAAFRVGHRTVWEAILDEANETLGGRDAAIALARPAMQYIDIASTQVAEAYLKEEQRLLATADRERRDLLENLLAGRLPGPAEGHVARGIDPAGDLLVAVARAEEGPAGDPHVLHHVAETLTAHAASGAVEPFVVVRQREVVGIIPTTCERAGVAADVLRAACEALLARRGIRLLVGLSTSCAGFAGVAHAYSEAREALEHADPSRPVVALTEMSPFEYLVASADASARRSIAAKGRRLLEADTDGTARETLLAYVAADLSVRATAERLVVHPNTVRYRLRRISELTGSDTRRFQDLVDLVTVIQVSRDGA